MNVEIAGYRFKKPELLQKALTHTSYSNEKHLESNQRLEFLGDSVIGLVIGEYIYEKYPSMPEGELSKIRAGIVCENGLVKCAEKIELGRRLLLGRGEEMSGGRNRASNLEDAFEALIGAVFLDSDFYTVKKFVLKVMKDIIEEIVLHDGIEDSKTAFQEYIQKHGRKNIEYVLVNEEGPDHNKIYTMQVKVGGKTMGMGKGHSKKDAEQRAAKVALEMLKNETY
ncbi:MAG: ribonuclease III [Ruminococcaceae bacterium]|nr:ribonuclease III [Oscillospiraceae bacterium]